MSKSRHTPGPWEACWTSGHVDVVCGNDLICEVMSSAGEDDAKFIATAPEMYRILRLLVHDASNSGKNAAREHAKDVLRKLGEEVP